MADQNIPVTADGDVTIDCDNDGTSTIQKIIFSHDNGTELARIQEDGKVGIGTATPGDKLHVAGTIRVDDGNAIRSAGGNIIVAGGGSGSNTEGVFFTDYGFNNSNGIFTGSGRFGVGTTSPGAKLDVRGDVIINEDGADKDVRIEGDTDVNLFFTDASADKVGIGLNAPAAKLHVKCDGSSVDQLRLENSQTGGKAWAISGGLDSAADLTIRNQTDGVTLGAFHYDSGNGIRAFRVGASSGTQSDQEGIGIGQQGAFLGSSREGDHGVMRLIHNPGQFLLQCGFRNTADNNSFSAGLIKIKKIDASNDKSDLLIQLNNGSGLYDVLVIKEDGKVGIGASSPGQKLEVNGGLKLASTAAPAANVLYSNSGVKGWVEFNDSGVEQASYNVSSVTDNGTGDWTVNWNTDFASGLYGVAHCLGDDTQVRILTWNTNNGKAGGSIQVFCWDTSGTKDEADRINLVVVGDQ